jgi:hypothetical protein
LANQKNINLRAGGCWNHQEIQKNTLKKDIGNPYSNPYTKQKFDQPGAQIYFWHAFHYKTNTFALSMCFLPSVRSETGVGAVSMSLSVLGPA